MRNAAPTPKQKQSLPQERPSFSLKKEVKTLSTPTGTLQTNHISIKKMIEKSLENNEVTEGEDLQNLPRTPFTIDDLNMYWRRFSHLIRQKGEETVFLAMERRDPKLLDDFQIQLEVDNQVQIDKLEIISPDLLKYLRENLKNWGIKINFTQIESAAEDIKLLTGKDKFEALKNKNANLTSFQRMFNLDVEY